MRICHFLVVVFFSCAGSNATQRNMDGVDGWVDGLGLTSFSTVFQSYQYER